MKRIASLFLLLFWASFAQAQRNGTPTFSKANTRDFDSVDLSTLVPTFKFPGIKKDVGFLPGNIALVSPQFCSTQSAQGQGTHYSCGVIYANSELAQIFPVPDRMLGFSIRYSNGIDTSCNNTVTTVITGLVGPDNLTFYPVPVTTLFQSGCGITTANLTTTDGTGITANITGGTTQNGQPTLNSVTDSSGWSESASNGTITVTDLFGNRISYLGPTSGVTGSFTDSIGAVTTLGKSSNTIPSSYQYVDANGSNQTIGFTSGTATTFKPFCNAGGQSVTPVTAINYPDGTSISIGWQPGNGGGLSGLMQNITLPTLGSISFSYGTPHCSPFYFTSLTRSDVDGNTQYSAVYNATSTVTTMLDAGMSKTVYTFIGGTTAGTSHFLSSVVHSQNINTIGNPQYAYVDKDVYTYNNNQSTPAYPITQRTDTHYVNNGSGGDLMMNTNAQTYGSHGELLVNTDTDNITNQTIVTTTVYGSFSGTQCQTLTGINNLPCTITKTSGSNQISQKQYTYESNGFLTNDVTWLSASSTLATFYAPVTANNGTATYKQMPNGQQIHYSYSGCSPLLQTSDSTTVGSVTLTSSQTWDCNSGKIITSTDPAGSKTTYTYDSMNRVSSNQDPTGFTHNYTYPATYRTDAWSITNPTAAQTSYTFLDNIGRTSTLQVTHGSTFDTKTYSYGFSNGYFQRQSTEPCSVSTLGNTCITFVHTEKTDMLGRPTSESTTNRETYTTTYLANDVSVSLTPAPSGEHAKTTQKEFDGFQRLKSTCGLLTSGGSSCGQTMGNSGIVTTYSYSFGAGSSTTTQTRGSQTHTEVYDAAGRITSITTPEAGTFTYVYDQRVAGYCDPSDAAYTSFGNLVATQDGSGARVCYTYDVLSRLTDTDTNQNIGDSRGKSQCYHYRYDSSANIRGGNGAPSTWTNVLGRMIESQNEDCVGNVSSEVYINGYDGNGRVTSKQAIGVTTNGQAHNANATYFLNGVLSAAGEGPTNYLTQTIDTDGKLQTSTVNGALIVNGITYGSNGHPSSVNMNATHMTDSYGYDANTGKMNSYSVANASGSKTGTLTWNANGTLAQLAITDTFNSGGAQTCNYSYDDVSRLTGDNCGSLFAQTFGYDPYDNLSQSGSFTWGCAGCYSSSNNHQTGVTYDGAGRVLYDGINTYVWDAYGKLVGVAAGTSAPMCAGPTTCIYYDGLGNPMSLNISGTNQANIPDAAGGMEFVIGSNVYRRLPQPGGTTVNTTQNQNITVEYPDWLGSTFLCTFSFNTSCDLAYAPYGEPYNQVQAPVVPFDFTGDRQDVFTGLYSTPTRFLLQNSGRWISPDLAHDPASWNTYAQATNPLSVIDPSGQGPQDAEWGGAFNDWAFWFPTQQQQNTSNVGAVDWASQLIDFANQNMQDYNWYMYGIITQLSQASLFSMNGFPSKQEFMDQICPGETESGCAITLGVYGLTITPLALGGYLAHDILTNGSMQTATDAYGNTIFEWIVKPQQWYIDFARSAGLNIGADAAQIGLEFGGGALLVPVLSSSTAGESQLAPPGSGCPCYPETPTAYGPAMTPIFIAPPVWVPEGPQSWVPQTPTTVPIPGPYGRGVATITSGH